MKIRFLLLAALFSWHLSVQAADLIDVYQQAQFSDPLFQQAVAQRLSTKEGVPISIAALLPTIALSMDPSVTRSGFSGTQLSSFTTIGSIAPRNTTQRYYALTLSANQTVFNFAQFSTVVEQLAISKSADATLNAALQNLMIRVATAYFNVLKDEDNLSYNEGSKLAYAEQLDQAKQQYKVGLKTITDVYTAQASYDSAVAMYINAETTLANDRENLRVITGKYYPHLSALSEDFPLLTPQPVNVETWVMTAQMQNWSIKASQYTAESAKQIIKQQFAGHLPTVSLEGRVDRLYTDSINGYRSLNDRHGPGAQSDRAIGLTINLPIFAGGAVVAQTNQAIYNFQVAQQQLEQTVRNTINTTRQSYLSIIAGVSQVSADKQAIKSNISSLQGMEASYNVGTTTLVDVLNQQQKLFQAQTTYATDRYNFVNNVLLLKQAAGTLSFNDLRAINAWLIEERTQVGRGGYSHYGKTRHHTSKKRLALTSSP
jgi:outer membrane protein